MTWRSRCRSKRFARRSRRCSSRSVLRTANGSSLVGHRPIRFSLLSVLVMMVVTMVMVVVTMIVIVTMVVAMVVRMGVIVAVRMVRVIGSRARRVERRTAA